MSRGLWIQGIGGASGDMILGALLALGVEAREVEEALRPLELGPFGMVMEPAVDHGLRGWRMRVSAEEAAGLEAHGGPRPHAHRAYRDIRAMIARAPLPAPVRDAALDAFRRLAEAEGCVHGLPPDEVEFHEVGAVDSMVDIVGACWARHRLDVADVYVEPLPMGSGTVVCAHGVYPVPAPATVELMRGAIVTTVDEAGETVTPTAAALLRSWANLDRLPPRIRILDVAYGLGHRTWRGRPNALRATLWDMGEVRSESDGCLVLECEVDDQTPELIGVLAGRLMEAGALDVFVVAAQMKKQRPGVLLTVLCRPERRDAMLDMLFREGTTFGVRERWTERHTLDRSAERVTTPYGEVRVKVGRWRGVIVTQAPEMDDCVRLAAERKTTPRAVYEAAFTAAHRTARDAGAAI